MPGLILTSGSGVTPPDPVDPTPVPTPDPPPTSPPAVWTPMVHTWTGWNGTAWTLSDRQSGVFLLAGVRGLTMPPVDRYASASPGVAGSRNRGHRIPEREVFFPVKVWTNRGSQEWIDYDAAWWRTFHPDRLGTYTVTQPNGKYRSLRLRFVTDGDPGFDTDPGRIGWARYGITLVAEDPYWAGPAIVRTWAAATSQNFFGSANAPSFYISSGSTLAGASLTNPGDVEAWPVWTLNAPFTSASLAVGGRTIEVPFAMASGSLTIDTDPRVQTAVTNTGVDRTGDLGAVGFSPVPAGAQVPLALSLAGAGSVTLSLTPRYYRAW